MRIWGAFCGLACTVGGALFAGDGLHAHFGGSFKSIFDYQHLRQTGVFASDDLPASEQRLRLQASADTDWLRLELVDQLSLAVQKPMASAVPLPSFNPASFWNTNSYWIQNSSTTLLQQVDRAFIQISKQDLELRVGKQVVDEGVGRIFNAVSQVPRYSFVYIDQEYPVTEDAATLLWKGPFTLEARYLPKVPGQQEDNIHLRAKGSKNGYDVALTGGRSDDKPYLGLEMAGNIGASLLRAEVVGYEWSERTAVQALLGWDRSLTSKLNAQLELFYNGFGSDHGPYELAPLVHRSAPYRGKEYGGAVLNWEISARWKSTLLTIVNLGDPSALFQLFIDYSFAENADLVLGQYLNVGSSRAEFGGQYAIPNLAGANLSTGLPDITYLELKYYF